MFAGKTFDPKMDFGRLKNNTQRVFYLMIDGRWHTPLELREVGGANWGARVRSLREPQMGSLSVEIRRSDTHAGVWLYRLDTSSLTDEMVDRVMRWDLPRVEESPKPKKDQWRECPACGGKGVVPDHGDESQMRLL